MGNGGLMADEMEEIDQHDLFKLRPTDDASTESAARAAFPGVVHVTRRAGQGLLETLEKGRTLRRGIDLLGELSVKFPDVT